MSGGGHQGQKSTYQTSYNDIVEPMGDVFSLVPNANASSSRVLCTTLGTALQQGYELYRGGIRHCNGNGVWAAGKKLYTKTSGTGSLLDGTKQRVLNTSI